VGLLGLLASGVEHKTLWDPTILGVLVFISAIGLFCGSVYLLVATNVGGRLGFLVAGACLMGFMVLLSGLWITTQTPLNSPRGRLPGWDPKEVVSDLGESQIGAVREIRDGGKRIETEEDLAQLRPGAEAALVRPDPEDPEAGEPSEFAEFDASTEFLTDFEGFEAYEVGGGTKNLFWHHPRYAVVQYCPTREVDVEPGEAPPEPSCDPLGERRFLVMEYDFGTVRQPPWIFFGVSLVLFVLFLLGLHWHEQDARATRRATMQPVPTPGA